MEVLSVQNQYHPERFRVLVGETPKSKDWSAAGLGRGRNHHHHHLNHNNNNNNNNSNGSINNNNNNNNKRSDGGHTLRAEGEGGEGVERRGELDLPLLHHYYCDNVDADAVNSLSLRLLDELRAAKTRNLTCTEVSIPCDLTARIASEIVRVSEREPCGVRGCTLYIEFAEEDGQNARRIATLKVDTEMVSTFELYLTLRQDKRGWASLLPQFMKSLSRSITISPEFSLTKHKLYSSNEGS